MTRASGVTLTNEGTSDQMTTQRPTRVGFIGVGIMARVHFADMLRRQDTEVVAVCEPAPAAYAAAAQLFDQHGVAVPPNEPDWRKWVATYAGELDAVVIITPHVLHFAQATACLEAGLDVFLEKPMVMNADEARVLIETRDRTGRLLVVGFQGSLSPQVREAARRIQSGELGRILNISAVAWQDWATLTAGTWRQQPELSGGGFLFDTGAHMLNTVADLAGEDFAEVAAWLENDGHPVDIRAVVMGRLASGALVTMNACGSAIPSCHSDIRVFTSRAIMRTGIWGEVLELQRAGAGRLRKVRSITSASVWEVFLDVRAGRVPNPSPPEVGLRMARLWDAIRESASRDGAVISLPRHGTGVPTGAHADAAGDPSRATAAALP
jgi:predicted dehydrogenase